MEYDDYAAPCVSATSLQQSGQRTVHPVASISTFPLIRITSVPASWGCLQFLKQIGHTCCEFSKSLLLADRIMPFLKCVHISTDMGMEASGACAVRDMALSTACVPSHRV